MGERWVCCQGFEKKDWQEKVLAAGKLSEGDDTFEDFEDVWKTGLWGWRRWSGRSFIVTSFCFLFSLSVSWDPGTAATRDWADTALRSQPGEGGAPTAWAGEGGPSGAHATLRGWRGADIGTKEGKWLNFSHIFKHFLVKLYCFYKNETCSRWSNSSK